MFNINLSKSQPSQNPPELIPESSTPSNPPPLSQSEALPAGSIEPTHFDALIGAGGAGEPPDGPSFPMATGGGDGPSLSKDDFHELFCGGFEAASLITDLKSLHVEKTDGKAKAASAALYDTINEIPALRFILQPQGKIAQRVLVLGVFFGGMARNVSAEIAEKRAAAMTTVINEDAGEMTESGIPVHDGLGGK